MWLVSLPRLSTPFLCAPLLLRYGIDYAVSDNCTPLRDLEPARRDLEFIPQDGIARWSPEA